MEVLGSIPASALYMPGTHQAFHHHEVGKLVSASVGVKSPLNDHGVVSVV